MDMTAAVSFFNGRISPVFDVSRQLKVLEVKDGTVIKGREEILDDDLSVKIEQLAAFGIKVLLCGAISKQAMGMLLMRNIQVIPFVMGEINAVIKAFIAGNLGRPRFVMPGCRRRGPRWLERINGIDQTQNPADAWRNGKPGRYGGYGRRRGGW